MKFCFHDISWVIRCPFNFNWQSEIPVVTLSTDCLGALQGLWEEKLGQVSIKLWIRQLEKRRIKPCWKGGHVVTVASWLRRRTPPLLPKSSSPAKNSKLAEEPVPSTKVVLRWWGIVTQISAITVSWPTVFTERAGGQSVQFHLFLRFTLVNCFWVCWGRTGGGIISTCSGCILCCFGECGSITALWQVREKKYFLASSVSCPLSTLINMFWGQTDSYVDSVLTVYLE